MKAGCYAAATPKPAMMVSIPVAAFNDPHCQYDDGDVFRAGQAYHQERSSATRCRYSRHWVWRWCAEGPGGAINETCEAIFSLAIAG